MRASSTVRVLGTAVSLVCVGLADAQTSLRRSVIACGGARAQLSSHVLSVTIGQPAAGSFGGPSVALNAGFWTGSEPRCPSDLDSDGSLSNGGTPDGGVTIDDLLFFLAAFELGDLAADLDDDGIDPPNPDGGVTIDDLLFFLRHFEAGC